MSRMLVHATSSRRSFSGRRAMRASLTVLVVRVCWPSSSACGSERILIAWNTLSHSFLPSMDRVFFPTVWGLALPVRAGVRLRVDVPAVLPASRRSCRCTTCGSFLHREGAGMRDAKGPAFVAEFRSPVGFDRR